MNGLLDNH